MTLAALAEGTARNDGDLLLVEQTITRKLCRYYVTFEGLTALLPHSVPHDFRLLRQPLAISAPQQALNCFNFPPAFSITI